MSDRTARQRWMGVLARTPVEDLERALATLAAREPPAPAYERLRGPEIGLAMVRGRAGGDGQRFNLGEMTVTRCSLRLRESGLVGHGYVAGRDKRRAELAALFDALLQDRDRQTWLERLLIGPAEAAQRTRRLAAEAAAARSKVDFFTMVRGETE